MITKWLTYYLKPPVIYIYIFKVKKKKHKIINKKNLFNPNPLLWQLMEDGTCRLVATLPQLDERRCPDMFRCSDEVSYWLHENEERKQQIVALKETISELQEELRNHRHRIKVLELQVTEAADVGQLLGLILLTALSLSAVTHENANISVSVWDIKEGLWIRC